MRRSSGRACTHAAAIGIALVASTAAHAQQIVEANWTATETRGAWQSAEDGIVPPAGGHLGSPVAFESGCGSAFVGLRIEQSTDAVALEVRTRSSYVFYFFAVQAGPKGASVLHTTGELGFYDAATADFIEAGASIELGPSESRLFVVDGVGNLMSDELAELDAQLAAVGGSIESFELVSGSYSLFSQPFLCTGTSQWTISDEDLVCDGMHPDCPSLTGASFTASSNASGLAVTASAGPAPGRIRLRCDFFLDAAACISYSQVGGFYCDGYPVLDGSEFPTPTPEIACAGLEGRLNLSAGWHTIEATEWDSGSGAFSISINGAPCDDCNGNGVVDETEIFWFEEYGFTGFGVPDGNGDGAIDLCQFARGDLDLSGSVGAADLAILLGSWGASGVPADLNNDGIVSALDLAILLANWDRGA